jgi:hypothetical protein
MRISTGFSKIPCSLSVRSITVDQLGSQSLEEKDVLYKNVEGTTVKSQGSRWLNIS